MGLDITAYKNVKLIGAAQSYEEYEENYDWRETDYIETWVPNHFGDAYAGTIPGSVYEAEDSFGFRAGSYSGYNYWRNWLSITFLGVSAQEVWDNAETYSNKPFWRLIEFADNEGVIGPIWSAKLAIDFANHQATVDALPCEQWLKDCYAYWRKAFEMAAQNGYVKFH